MNKQKIVQAIRKKMNAEQHTQSDVAALTGVDQPQISRILKGQFVRDSKNVQLLCDYAGFIPADSVDPSKSKLLMDALRKVWDGSRPKEKALARIIQNLADL